MKLVKFFISGSLFLIGFSSSVLAAEHVIKAVGVAFKPMIVLANPGDTIKWVNMPTHNAESVEGMIPEDGTPWRSVMSQDFAITIDKEGVYIYKCAPHIGLGMGGAIVVGNPVNLDAVTEAAPKNPYKRIVKKAKKAIKKAGLDTNLVKQESVSQKAGEMPEKNRYNHAMP
jgi:pseudoazurin